MGSKPELLTEPNVLAAARMLHRNYRLRFYRPESLASFCLKDFNSFKSVYAKQNRSRSFDNFALQNKLNTLSNCLHEIAESLASFISICI